MATYNVESIINHSTQKQHSKRKSVWVAARPDNYRCQSLLSRIREAYRVLVGKVDTIQWPDGQ